MNGKYIIFDFDGTLIDTERVMLQSVKEFASMRGVRHDDDFLLQFVGVSPKDIINILNGEYGNDFDAKEFLYEAVKYFNNTLLCKLTPLRPGAREVLDYFKREGWTIALATTTQSDVVFYELKKHDLEKYFVEVVTGDTVKHNKPSPEIYVKTCDKLNINPNDCYSVEDSTVGIMASISAGLKTIAVPDLHKVRDDLVPQCEAIFNNCFEIIDYFEKIKS